MEATRRYLETVMDPSDKSMESAVRSDLLTAMQLLNGVIRCAQQATGRTVVIEVPNTLFEEIYERVHSFDS